MSYDDNLVFLDKRAAVYLPVSPEGSETITAPPSSKTVWYIGDDAVELQAKKRRKCM